MALSPCGGQNWHSGGSASFADGRGGVLRMLASALVDTGHGDLCACCHHQLLLRKAGERVPEPLEERGDPPLEGARLSFDSSWIFTSALVLGIGPAPPE